MTIGETIGQMRAEAAALYKANPRVMTAFQQLMTAAGQEGALSAKHKELIALAIAVHARCEGCVTFHVDHAIKHGATREEVGEAIGVAIEMGGGPATYYGGKALAAFDELSAT